MIAPWRLIFAVLIIAVSCLQVNSAAAEPVARWSGQSALTLPEDRIEVGAFSMAAWGVTDRIEVQAHPLSFVALALPHGAAKFRLLDTGRLSVSLRHQLSLPTMFLRLVAREGTLGLLPPDRSVPWALMLDNSALATLQLAPDTFLTLAAGAELAAQEDEPVLLDFPFLYQRFAALNAPVVPHAALGVEAQLLRHWDTRITSTYYYLPLTNATTGFAWESQAELGWSFSDDTRLSASYRVTLARYPVGRRWHSFPLVDLRWAY